MRRAKGISLRRDAEFSAAIADVLGGQMRVIVRTLVLLVGSILMPAALFAQAVIAGSVKDASGGVLPGVNVEAPVRR